MKKLAAKQVAEIRLRRVKGETLQSIADKYDLSISTVSNIVNGNIWKLLPALTCPHCKKAIR